jgi:hypothetical protein
MYRQIRTVCAVEPARLAGRGRPAVASGEQAEYSAADPAAARESGRRRRQGFLTRTRPIRGRGVRRRGAGYAGPAASAGPLSTSFWQRAHSRASGTNSSRSNSIASPQRSQRPNVSGSL